MANRPALLLLLGLVAALGACSGGDDGDSGGGGSTSSTSEAPQASTSAASTSTSAGATTDTSVPAGEGIAPVEQVLPSLVVHAGELAEGGFVDAGYVPDGNACGSPAASAGSRLESASLGTTVVEELHVYAGVEEAAEAFSSCVPEGAADVTAEVGGDDARQSGATFYARVADAVLTVTVTGDGGEGGAGPAPAPVEIAAFAVGKVSGYLEAGAG
jgi:hypothetical protein